MITVRPATAADIDAISRVLIASITDLCHADHHGEPDAVAAWTANKSPCGVRAMLDNPATRILVAEMYGAIGAVGAVSTSGAITLNYVAPNLRYHGLSKALLAQLEQELARLGHTEARLEATATARTFYLGAGWVADGPQAEGRRVNGYPMRKAI